jgi:hypothetical protein
VPATTSALKWSASCKQQQNGRPAPRAMFWPDYHGSIEKTPSICLHAEQSGHVQGLVMDAAAGCTHDTTEHQFTHTQGADVPCTMYNVQLWPRQAAAERAHWLGSKCADLLWQAGLDREGLVEELLVEGLLRLVHHDDGDSMPVKLRPACAAHHLQHIRDGKVHIAPAPSMNLWEN